jgi:hypothetical protein
LIIINFGEGMDSVERAVSDVSDEALAAIGGSESVDRFVGYVEKEPGFRT